jgi:hypothetical protein
MFNPNQRYSIFDNSFNFGIKINSIQVLSYEKRMATKIKWLE